MAQKLGIFSNGVPSPIKNIYRKPEVNSRAEAASSEPSARVPSRSSP
ncbi:hypothetical protein [Dinoroseobacter sp. S375]